MMVMVRFMFRLMKEDCMVFIWLWMVIWLLCVSLGLIFFISLVILFVMLVRLVFCMFI